MPNIAERFWTKVQFNKAVALAALITTGMLGGGTDGQIIRIHSRMDVRVISYWTDSSSNTSGELDASRNWSSRVATGGPGRVEAVGNVGTAYGLLLWQGIPNPPVVERAEVQVIICAAGLPWTCEWAEATVLCESGGLTTALATEIYEGKRYWFHGLWQIASTSPLPRRLALPEYNTEIAAEKYRSGGPGHWPNCG